MIEYTTPVKLAEIFDETTWTTRLPDTPEEAEHVANLELLASIVSRVELENSTERMQLLARPNNELNALQTRLRALSVKDPAAMTQRKVEIRYLANVLMADGFLDELSQRLKM